jgi:hypothetical protein
MKDNKLCSGCIFWSNADEETKWNKQHEQYLEFPYKEYGICNSEKMKKHIFQDIQKFGNYTHKNFGCVFNENKNK